MDKKKVGALIAALVAALTAFWYTYSSEVEKTDEPAQAPVVEPAPVEPLVAPAPVETAAPVEPEVAPVEVK